MPDREDKSLRIELIMGEIIIEARELPLKRGKTARINKMFWFLAVKNSHLKAFCLDIKLVIILEPSRGGIGRRLKTAKLTLKIIKGINIGLATGRSFNNKLNIVAKIRLLAGPAKAIREESF